MDNEIKGFAFALQLARLQPQRLQLPKLLLHLAYRLCVCVCVCVFCVCVCVCAYLRFLFYSILVFST